MKLFFLFCLSFYVVCAKHEIYDGYVVYEVYPKTVDGIQLVNAVADELTLDTWSYPTLSKPGHIFVSDAQKKPFENALNALGVEYKPTVQNIRELLELEDQKLAAAAAARRNRNTTLTFDDIYSFEEVTEYLAAIAHQYPNVTKLVDAGTSFEGRPIQYLEISTTGFQDTSKPVIFLQSLLHAREWVTLPATLYAIHKLVVDVTESDVVENIDWVVTPVANPDGYIFSRTNDRFWRKNRRTGLVPLDACVGVDLNRNFDIDWGTLSSSNVCAITFHGRGPNSEPETQVVADTLAKYRSRLAMFSDIHSFGSMILYGWGNGTLVHNALALHLAGVRMAQAIDRVKWESKPNYVVGNTFAVLQYTVSGSSTDYGHAVGIPYAFTYELPGLLGATGVNGFLVDPEFIEQSAVETWESIVAGGRHVLGVL